MSKFLPVIDHLTQAYKMWYQWRDHTPKKARHTLVGKIDSLFVEILEFTYTATYQNPERKLLILEAAITKIDILKFFLRIVWDIGALDNKKYIALSEQIEEIGKMVGGWRRSLATKTSD